MVRFLRLVMLGVLGCGLFPSIAFAQASITGVVRDTSGAVLPGVTVEAASPALIEKVRSVVTDGSGQYRVVDLRPGVYTVTFSLPGFNTTKREGVELTGTFVATVDAEMRVGEVQETVTVTGASPIVDVQNVTKNRVLDKAVIDALPTSLSPGRLATLIPGVTSSLNDVGGTSVPIGLNNVSVHGGRDRDQRIQMDGLTTQSALCTGNCGSYLPNMAAAQEVNVTVAGGGAESAIGGVVMNVIPREGGNTFSGSFFGAFANDSMQGSNFTQRLKDAGLRTPSAIRHNYDANGAGGGRIIRDKLWFFASARQTGFSNYVGNLFDNKNAGNLNAWTYDPDTSRPTYGNVWQRTGNARLTWQATSRSKLAFFYDRQSRCQCPAENVAGGISPTISKEAGRSPHVFPGTDLLTVSYSSPISSRVLLEASAMNRRENMNLPRKPADINDPIMNLISVSEQSTGLTYRGIGLIVGGSFLEEDGDVTQMKGAVSYITGSHALKFGIQQQFMALNITTDTINPALYYRFNNGVPNQLTQVAAPYTTRQRNPWDLGLFVQDRWTLQRLTVNAGVRFDYYTTSYPEQHLGPSRFTPNRNITIAARDFVNHKDISPRLGVSYDLFGNRRTAVQFTANRYLAALGLETTVTDNFNPAKNFVQQVSRSWNDTIQNFQPDCDLMSTAANGECGAMLNALFGQAIPSASVDPDVVTGWGTRDYNWEFSTGVQQQLAQRVSVDVAYFRRIYGGSWTSTSTVAPTAVVDNLAVSPADFSPFSITAPLDPRLPGGGGYVISGLYDLNPDKVGQVSNLLTTPDKYGKRIEHWNGVDVLLRVQPTAGLLFQGGVSSGRTLTDQCDQLRALPEDSPVGLPYCRVETLFRTQVKFNGSYTIPRIDVQVAGNFQSLPGSQISANLNVPSAIVATSLGRPLSGGAANATVNLVAPGTMYRERLNQLDLRIGKILRFGRARTAINVDVYNALNADTILNSSNNYANWLQPLAILQARFAKINVQFDF